MPHTPGVGYRLAPRQVIALPVGVGSQVNPALVVEEGYDASVSGTRHSTLQQPCKSLEYIYI